VSRVRVEPLLRRAVEDLALDQLDVVAATSTAIA
jgi:hypothetical protein